MANTPVRADQLSAQSPATVNALKSALGVDSIVPAVTGFTTAAPSTSITTGSYINYLTGAITSAGSYEYVKFTVTPGETVYLSASLLGNTTALAVFFDANGNYVSYDTRSPSGTPATYSDQPVVVPAGAATLGMSQQTQYRGSFPMTCKRKSIQSLLPDRIAALEALDGKFWAGKKIVWFGTSIPAGAPQGGMYPQQVAASLGASITNESVSGSAFRAGVRSLVVDGSDPYGWTGRSWSGLMWSLGMNLTEKQYLIDNWSTIGPTLSNSPPATLTQANIDAAKACSYENKLVVNHLGANRKDIYVFDAPFNDYGMYDDLTTAGTGGSRDRLTYLGVMNFLIDLIMADNPKARIIFTGHYENQKYPTISQAQTSVAGFWNRPLFRLWDALGWSQQTITTTGYWSNGLWVASGGSSQTITLLDRWLPDGTHPHLDNSGSAVARITEVMLPWFSYSAR